MLAQEAAIAFDARTQHLCRFRHLPRHLGSQRVADIDIQRSRIGVSGGGGRHRDPAAVLSCKPSAFAARANSR